MKAAEFLVSKWYGISIWGEKLSNSMVYQYGENIIFHMSQINPVWLICSAQWKLIYNNMSESVIMPLNVSSYILRHSFTYQQAILVSLKSQHLLCNSLNWNLNITCTCITTLTFLPEKEQSKQKDNWRRGITLVFKCLKLKPMQHSEST